MNIKTTKLFDRDYNKISPEIKKRAEKQFAFLLDNWKHPSLAIKKIKREKNVWEARITRDYRFSFKVFNSVCLLRRIGKHDDVLKNP